MREREIVGRGSELDRTGRFLDRLASGPAALVLEGVPGIGKTTVWQEGMTLAHGRGIIVLSCRAVQAEAKLAFSALTDLLDPIADATLPRLPEPHRLALGVALMRETPRGTTPSARAVATALLSALRLLVAESPIVLAIDDQHWLDRPSSEALAFALRRIGEQRLGILTTVRVEDDVVRDPLALDTSFGGHVERVRLAPLSLSGLHHVIHSHVDRIFPRPTLRRIADTSGGNPFFALELARALIDADEHLVPGKPLPMPDTLSRLLARRLARLPASARTVLLAVAALSAPTVKLVRRSVGGANVAGAIEEAERERWIDVRDDHITFVHPLFASAVYAAAPGGERREMHRRLAAIITTPEERARHLALAAARPDAAVARVLDDAALVARRRGAPGAAGELEELATGLTPRDDAGGRRRRMTKAGEHFLHAGDRMHARVLLEAVLNGKPTRAERAPALHLLGQLCGQEDDLLAAIRYFEEALDHCTEPQARVAIQLDLAFAVYSSGDLPRAIDVASSTLPDAERLGDPGLIACALGMLETGEFMAGRGGDGARMARALALEDHQRECQVLLRPTAMAGMLAVYEGRPAEAEPLLRTICDWARERGEETGIPLLLSNLSRVAWLRGDLAAATAHADEALLLAAQSGSERMFVLATVHRSRARAMRGDIAGARADLAEARTLIEKSAFMRGIPWLLASEGLLELSLGDLRAAGRALEPLAALVEVNGVREPMQAYYLPDVVETLIGLGELGRAGALLENFAHRAREMKRPFAIAAALRCRSLLAAAQGDLDAAVAHAEEAVERFQSLEMPIEIGRSLLVLGQVRRRRKERRVAREATGRALAQFQDMGAAPWAELAAAELRRIPIRRPASKHDLTPTEEQVAELAAAGRTNREVALALHMSRKTVEANLGRVHDKLGIGSRAELGARMLSRRAARRPRALAPLSPEAAAGSAQSSSAATMRSKRTPARS